MFSITIITHNAHTHKKIPKYITYLPGEDRKKNGVISLYELNLSQEMVKAEIMNCVSTVVQSICW